MELFIMEHGDSIKSAIMGMFIISMLGMSILMLYTVMPEYNKKVSADSTNLAIKIQENSPVITAREIIYADFQDEGFDIRKLIKAVDSDGKDISDRIEIKGTVDISTKGLYVIWASVTNDHNYSDRKKIQVVVE